MLLTAEGVAKIADVGLAKVMTNGEQQSWGQTVGTFAYAAPELIIGSLCTDKARAGLAPRATLSPTALRSAAAIARLISPLGLEVFKDLNAFECTALPPP